jgi:oligoendopeptidase F
MEKLKWSDRNAPMPFADTTVVPFDKAMEIVLAAYGSFSPTLASLVKDFAATHRVDAPVAKGRRSGAYNCSLVLPGDIPTSFVFLNYLGSDNDVMTLAHELGHGVHGMLAGAAQGPLMAQAPIAYAETASVFGEMTTFNFLKKQLQEKNDTKALLALIMGKIDANLNTVVRQIGFSNFERRLHGMDAQYQTWTEPKKLSAEELDTIWLETLKEFYGNDGEIFIYENTEHLWTYVSHFHRPFYVYGYAFGELLTQSLYAQQSHFGDRFEPLYLELLRSGSTKNVMELLVPFELDPTKKDFWENGIRGGLEVLIQEAEHLATTL